MNASTRNRALRAAARLAVGVTFGACGGAEITAIVPLDSGLDARKFDGSSERDSAINNDIDAATVNTTDAGWCSIAFQDAGTITPEAKQCCLALTVANSPADAGFSFDPSLFKSDPSVKACCKALYDGSGSSLVMLVYGPDKWPAATCNACADAIEQPSACTPWGPPVPPAMTGIA